MHGANASGRPFTGDYAGIFLYEALHEFGFSNALVSESATDGLILKNARITNAVKCLPPQNKPTGEEINVCNAFLAKELKTLPENSVILALGLKISSAKFAHNATHELPNGHFLIDSYHTSRYNVNTKRLTKESFNAVFETIMPLLNQS
jgi:uracil-DNA glycosylase family 4